MTQPAYSRILLKMSGEALMGDGQFGIDPKVIARLAHEVKNLVAFGVQVGIVIGGGNIFRGAGLAQGGLERTTGDHIGMLATVMNSLVMADALHKQGQACRVYSALTMTQVCEEYTKRAVVEQLQQGTVTILSAGTGNPYFTTDSAACLRAIEIQADLVIKATKVDGVYSSDPMKNMDAQFYPHLNYNKVLAENLAVMDATAIVLCRDNQMPLRVCNIYQEGLLMKLMAGENLGTLVDDQI